MPIRGAEPGCHPKSLCGNRVRAVFRLDAIVLDEAICLVRGHSVSEALARRVGNAGLGVRRPGQNVEQIAQPVDVGEQHRSNGLRLAPGQRDQPALRPAADRPGKMQHGRRPASRREG